MKIIEVKTLKIPEIKVIKFARFADHRGYFAEHYRKGDFEKLKFMQGINFTQTNESYSKAGTFRGLHFQWNPYMAKLVRPLAGHLIDFALDIRKNSPTFGKIVAYDMPINVDQDYSEWLWLPPGFAHGVLLLEDTLMEYYCTGQWSPECERGISPLDKNIAWTLCDVKLKRIFDEIVPNTELITDKDKNGLTLAKWQKSKNAANFIYGKV